MAMLLIGIQGNARETTKGPSVAVADALGAIKSEIDVLGWFEQAVSWVSSSPRSIT